MVFVWGGCSGTSAGGADSAPDASAQELDVAPIADAASESSAADVADARDRAEPDSGAGFDSNAGDQEADAGPGTPHTYLYKAVGGISMGACSMNLHVHNPGIFDHVMPLGGYINYQYIQDLFHSMMFAGFCDMQTILAHVDELNDPDVPELQCGPVAPRHPWEFAIDFNHWHYDDSGGEWDRDSMWDVSEGIFTAFGNLLYHNPEHPLLPPGVPVSWLAPGDGAEKCKNVVHVGPPHNYSLEYNPEGEYDLITFCDGEEPVPGGKGNPDYKLLMGVFDPTYEHTRPVPMLLAVDYNGNGRRDYHEPIVMNPMERFEDVGGDGCGNDLEDGQGGCTGSGAGEDPNGDDYDNVESVFGTEGNAAWDQGEPFADNGLDGVAGTGDFGEEDGDFSMAPALKKLLDESAVRWLDTAPIEEVASADFLFDGGIRDGLHSLVGTWPLAIRLEKRVPDTRIYKGYTEQAESLYPASADVLLLVMYDQVDWSPEGLGKNLLVRYGKEDATQEEIDAGDGKHIGTDNDMLNRVAAMIFTSLMRWPGLDSTKCQDHAGELVLSSFYSEALQGRGAYAISLPPCYSAPGWEDETYPLIMFLPGHGMSPPETIAAGVAFNILMQGGILPKFVLAVPEGQCCRVNLETGERYCACATSKEDGNYWACVDPQCKLAHDQCGVVNVVKSSVVQECNRGHFFANQTSNAFGDVEAAKKMRYEDMVVEFVEYLEKTYRLREPLTVEAP